VERNDYYLIRYDKYGNILAKGVYVRPEDGLYRVCRIYKGRRMPVICTSSYEESCYISDCLGRGVLPSKDNNTLVEKPSKFHKKEEMKLKKLFDEPSFVYFITDGEFVKIGQAKEVHKRLVNLQVGNVKKLTLLKIIPTFTPLSTERHFHELFSMKLVTGEWYDILDLFKEVI
jgi:hypothetical protein